jgi:hypothetical protein
MPKIIEVLRISDYHLKINLEIFYQELHYYNQKHQGRNTDKVVINDNNIIIGTPVYENKTFVTCPECQIGFLFRNDLTNHIECTIQTNCNFKLSLKHKSDGIKR